MTQHNERSDPVRRAREFLLNVEHWLDVQQNNCKRCNPCGESLAESLAEWERELLAAPLQAGVQHIQVSSTDYDYLSGRRRNWELRA